MSGMGTSAKPEFLCGVVEGFYHRPWSHAQRLQLFERMKKYGLNCYLYAPKDDHKHRSLWREPYDEREKTDLKTLIEACKERGIIFLYGISPGLDITYSLAKDVTNLKTKLADIKALGCEAFALLWDDIDTSLPVADEEEFDSLAEAHVEVTNEVFNYLGRPLFLTCPVEYCANRSDPDVDNSEYLNTLGSGLKPDIGIFWTGSRVVSETITKEELIQLQKVIKRKPIIWDNLHANDYDHQRIFLGPYAGRDPDIIPHLRGSMINPNCEYSFNIPALFTLGEWRKCFKTSFDGPVSPYEPEAASRGAITEFLDECKRPTRISHASTDFNSRHRKMSERERKNMELNPIDIELLFHFFWLPHSNGPKGEMLVNEFKFLRDHAHLVHNIDLRMDDSDEDSDDEHKESESIEHEFIESWMERASSFNNLYKRFSKMCDKFTMIENRELFFDINSYLNNIQIILSACNRYLRWVGLERCRKPIQGGPSLAGLQGGLAGELQRIFPIQSNYEYPVRRMIPIPDKNAFQICPYTKQDYPNLRNEFLRLFCDSCNVDADQVVQTSVRNFLMKWRLGSYLDQPDASAIGVEFNDNLQGLVVGTKNVRSVVESQKRLNEEDKQDHSLSKRSGDDAIDENDEEEMSNSLPISLTGRSKDIPWELVESCDAIYSVTLIPELLFTKTAANLMTLAETITLTKDSSSKKSCIILGRGLPVTRQFLSSVHFLEAYRGDHFVILIKNSENDDDSGNGVEKMDEQ